MTAYNITMVEKVALALYERARIRNQGSIGGDILLPFDQCRPSFLADAEAAIEAMHEPTEKMLDAASETGTYGGIADCGGLEPNNFDPEEVWNAMIKSADKR